MRTARASSTGTSSPPISSCAGAAPRTWCCWTSGWRGYAVPTLMGVTGSHTVVGTPGYMAPEQASSQPEILPAADIFSLGCVLYECLTGTPPFAAPHFAAALAKILFAEPATLTTLRPGLPAGCRCWWTGCWPRSPSTGWRTRMPCSRRSRLWRRCPSCCCLRARRRCPPFQLAEGEQKLVSVLLLAPRTRVP